MAPRGAQVIGALAGAAWRSGSPPAAEAATEVNVALVSDGASFVAVSSHDSQAAGAPLRTMQNNLLTDTPALWLPPEAGDPKGDSRYIFGDHDTDQRVEIELAAPTAIDAIGANVALLGTDRYVVGPYPWRSR